MNSEGAVFKKYVKLKHHHTKCLGARHTYIDHDFFLCISSWYLYTIIIYVKNLLKSFVKRGSSHQSQFFRTPISVLEANRVFTL